VAENGETAVVIAGEDQKAQQQETDRPGADRGDRRSGDPHLRQTPAAEDQGVVERDVDDHAEQGAEHHRPGHPPAGEEGRQRGDGDMEDGAAAEDIEIDPLQGLDLRAVAGEAEQRPAGDQGKEPEDQAGEQGEIDPLPQHPADLAMGAAAAVLGDEHPGVAADPAEEGHEQEGGDAGRRGGGDRLEVVVGEKGAVGEFHYRGRRHARHQRQADPDDVMVAAATAPMADQLEHAGGMVSAGVAVGLGGGSECPLTRRPDNLVARICAIGRRRRGSGKPRQWR